MPFNSGMLTHHVTSIILLVRENWVNSPKGMCHQILCFVSKNISQYPHRDIRENYTQHCLLYKPGINKSVVDISDSLCSNLQLNKICYDSSQISIWYWRVVSTAIKYSLKFGIFVITDITRIIMTQTDEVWENLTLFFFCKYYDNML